MYTIRKFFHSIHVKIVRLCTPLEQPISPNSQPIQSSPTKAVQNDLEWPISPDSQLLQSFLIKPAQNDSEWATKSSKYEMLIFSEQQNLIKMSKNEKIGFKNKMTF